MTNTLGPVMLAGLGIFIAWLAISGKASAVASAITGAQAANGFTPDAGQAGASAGAGGSWGPPAPGQISTGVSWTPVDTFGGNTTTAPDVAGGNGVILT